MTRGYSAKLSCMHLVNLCVHLKFDGNKYMSTHFYSCSQVYNVYVHLRTIVKASSLFTKYRNYVDVKYFKDTIFKYLNMKYANHKSPSPEKMESYCYSYCQFKTYNRYLKPKHENTLLLILLRI